MKTIGELIALEQYIAARRIPGESVEPFVTAFNALPRYPEPPPLYRPKPDSLRKFFAWQFSKFIISPAESVEAWLGNEFVEKHLKS